MIWKGKHLRTIEDLMRDGIDKCDTEQEAQEFILLYVGENLNARSNIGYLAGYYSEEDQDRIFKWFDVVHPVYGTKRLPMEQLFKIGQEHGRRIAHPDKYKTEDIDPVDFIRANIKIK